MTSYLQAYRLRKRLWAAQSAKSNLKLTLQARERAEDTFLSLDKQLKKLGIEDDLDNNFPENALTLTAVNADTETEATRVVESLLDWRWKNKTTLYGTEAFPPIFAVLAGLPGCGKTVALVRGVQNLIHDSSMVMEGRFERAFDIAAQPRNGGFTAQEQWEMWIHVPALAVDDAGVEPGDPTNLGQLFLERWEGGLVTLVSTNLTKSAFIDRYMGEKAARFADRLKIQPGWFYECGSESLRKPLV